MPELEHTTSYASKGVAGSGLGLGIAGTALGLMNNGSLGGLFGGGQQLTDAKAEIATLKAEQYTDRAVLAERDRHMEWARQLAAQDASIRAMGDKIAALTLANAKDIQAAKEESALRIEIAQLKAEKDTQKVRTDLQAAIDLVASTSAQGIQRNSDAIAGLQAVVNGIVRPMIPAASVCGNTGCGCNQ